MFVVKLGATGFSLRGKVKDLLVAVAWKGRDLTSASFRVLIPSITEERYRVAFKSEIPPPRNFLRVLLFYGASRGGCSSGLSPFRCGLYGEQRLRSAEVTQARLEAWMGDLGVPGSARSPGAKLQEPESSFADLIELGHLWQAQAREISAS